MLYELSIFEVSDLQSACTVAKSRMEENAKSFERCANDQRVSESQRASAARMAKWFQARAANFENASETLDWGREITTLAQAKEALEHEGFVEPAALVVAGSADLVHGRLCGGRQKAQSSHDGGADAGHLAAGNVGGMRRMTP